MDKTIVQPVRGDTIDPQRDRILQLSASLFASDGYQAVGVAAIGASVGLGRGALYYHIGSKEELLFDIVSKYITELVDEGGQIVGQDVDPRKKVKLLSAHMMKVVSGNLAEMTVCFRESEWLTGERHEEAKRLHARYQALWVGVFAEGHRAGIFRQLPPVAVKGLLGMYYHSFLWLNPNGRSSALQIADVFADIVLRTLDPAAAANTAEVRATGDRAPRASARPSSRKPRSTAPARAPGKPSASLRARKRPPEG